MKKASGGNEKKSVADERAGLTEDEIEKIRKTCNLFKNEESGKIDPKDIKAAMQSLGLENKDPYQIISELEELKRDIDFEEFVDAIKSKLGKKTE